MLLAQVTRDQTRSPATGRHRPPPSGRSPPGSGAGSLVRADGAGASHELIRHLLSLSSARRIVLFTCGWMITGADEDAIRQVPGSHHPQYIDVAHREHACAGTAGVRTAKAMGMRGLPSKTWQVNCGWVLAANIAADPAAWTRLPPRPLRRRRAARVRRDGRVQAKGSPLHHATLGPLEDWLEEKAGQGVIDGIAERAVLRQGYVKGERERLLARAFMIRVIVLMTLMPDAGIRDVIIALAGDLALVPWPEPWVPEPERVCGDWRNALGPEPLEELQDIVHHASHAGHEDRDWRAAVIGKLKRVTVSSADGTLIRVPDTPANRECSVRPGRVITTGCGTRDTCAACFFWTEW